MSFKLTDLTPSELPVEAIATIEVINQHLRNLLNGSGLSFESKQEVSRAYEKLAQQLGDDHPQYAKIEQAASEMRLNIIATPVYPRPNMPEFHGSNVHDNHILKFNTMVAEYAYLKKINASAEQKEKFEQEMIEYAANCSIHSYGVKEKKIFADWSLRNGNYPKSQLALGLSLLADGQQEEGARYVESAWVLSARAIEENNDKFDLSVFVRATEATYFCLNERGDKTNAEKILKYSIPHYPPLAHIISPDYMRGAISDRDAHDIKNSYNPKPRHLRTEAFIQRTVDADPENVFFKQVAAIYYHAIGAEHLAYREIDRAISFAGREESLIIKSKFLADDKYYNEAEDILVAMANPDGDYKEPVLTLSKIWRMQAIDKFAEGCDEEAIDLAMDARKLLMEARNCPAIPVPA